MAVVRTIWQKVQHLSWLILALACFFFALVFWAKTSSSDQLVEIEKPQVAQAPIQPHKVAATTNLGMLSGIVKPLESNVRVVTIGNHAAQFRGTQFIQDNKNKWTIELFRAADENIIKNYLKSQNQRDNFIYFRLVQNNQDAQYVLDYGNFDHELDALKQMQKLQLNLPTSVKPKAVALSSYAKQVNDMGMDEMNEHSAEIHEVVLKHAPVVPIRITPPTTPAVTTSTSSFTSTTVTRRDAKGNVVNVQRQGTSGPTQPPVTPAKPATHVNTTPSKTSSTATHEISDPFN